MIKPVERYAEGLGASEEVLWWINTTLSKTQSGTCPLSLEQCEHIVDYFIRCETAPKRLKRMSVAQALISATKWSEAQQKKGLKIVEKAGDVEKVFSCSAGPYEVVKLLTKNALVREGHLMRHCVGGYDPASSEIYSLRDRSNNPHATLEIGRERSLISQVKGKGNGHISPRYIHAVIEFLESLGMEIRNSEMLNLGYGHVEPELEELCLRVVNSDGSRPSLENINGKKYLKVAE